MMKKTILALMASAALAATAYAQQQTQSQPPANGGKGMANQYQPNANQNAYGRNQLPNQAMANRMIAPASLSSRQVRQIQQALNRKGFDAGHVDGIWGPQTREAVENFQTAENIQGNGSLNSETVSKLGLNQQQFAKNQNRGGRYGKQTFTTGSVSNRLSANQTMNNNADVTGSGSGTRRSGSTSNSPGNQQAMNSNGGTMASKSGTMQNGSASSAQNGSTGNSSGLMQNNAVSSEQTGSIQPGNIDLQAFQQVRVPIDQAISRAKAKLSGAIIGAAFTQQDGKPAYRVRAYDPSSGAVRQAMVDAESGKVMGNPSTVQKSQLNAQEQSALNASKSTRTSLSDAVQAAVQKSNGGKAAQAMLIEANGKPVYHVIVANKGSTHTYEVDSQTGKVAGG